MPSVNVPPAPDPAPQTVYEVKAANGQKITVRFSGEPSDAAWRRFAEVGVRILENLADRDARAEAERAANAEREEEATRQQPRP
ncbi:hypothetical protein K8F61_09870 [Microbacterium resistens]|uniref:Uncharacterized protein n=1 Tax=Microbacterium resistens TaxID=156977 RepID=A0ABY3RQL5_9MICO|nr:hypothetical protein [Microbacterium resistens]UGS25016.1 hypothetical protein K8F61_09870 [Microbacterium resistens]